MQLDVRWMNLLLLAQICVLYNMSLYSKINCRSYRERELKAPKRIWRGMRVIAAKLHHHLSNLTNGVIHVQLSISLGICVYLFFLPL